MIKGLQLVFNLLLYFHLKACFWQFICDEAKIWGPPSDFVYGFPNNEKMRLRMFNDELVTYSYQYWAAFYNSVIYIKGNEIGPRSLTETVVCSFILIFDLIVAGNIFGNVSVLVQMSNRKAKEFQNQVDNANTSMKNMMIPKTLNAKVQHYIISTQSTLD